MPVITVCFLMLGVQVLLMLVLGLLQRFVQGATLRTIAQVVLGLTVAVFVATAVLTVVAWHRTTPVNVGSTASP